MARGDRTIKFTDDNVKKLPAVDGKRTYYTDALLPGFALRVSPNGSRSYSFQYRVEGVQERFTIGDIRKTTLAGARDTARNLLRGGTNPAEQKRKTRLLSIKDENTAPRFEHLCDAFVKAEEEHWRPATKLDWVRYIEKEIKPSFGTKLQTHVTADDVQDMIDEINDRAPVAARRCFEVIRRICRWAIKKRLLTVDPTVAVALERQERRRKRAPLKPYDDDQIRGIFAAAEGTELEHPINIIARTGVRSHEARSARIIDLKKEVWSIPAEFHKNGSTTGLPHLVPLPTALIRAFKAIYPEDETWFFPAPTTKCRVCPRAGHMDPPKAGTIVAKIKETGGVQGRGLLHRFRDTIKTRMSEQMIDSRVSEHILGHIVVGIGGTYDHAELLPQRKEALEWWSQELDKILKGGKK